MNTIAPSLVAASAAIMLLLGLLHLLYTFYSPQLLPRDDALHTRMQEVSLVITRQTTMWKAWVGFNASHSYGLILFGTVDFIPLKPSLPGCETHSEIVQGATEFHHQITDPLLPQADPVFHNATALDTAIDMLNPQPALVQSLVHALLR